MATWEQIRDVNVAKRTLVNWRRSLPGSTLTSEEKALAVYVQKHAFLPPVGQSNAGFRIAVFDGVNLASCLLTIMHTDIYKDYAIGQFGASWIAAFVKWGDPFALHDPWHMSAFLGKERKGNRDVNYHWYFGIDPEFLDLRCVTGRYAMDVQNRNKVPYYNVTHSISPLIRTEVTVQNNGIPVNVKALPTEVSDSLPIANGEPEDIDV